MVEANELDDDESMYKKISFWPPKKEKTIVRRSEAVKGVAQLYADQKNEIDQLLQLKLHPDILAVSTVLIRDDKS